MPGIYRQPPRIVKKPVNLLLGGLPATDNFTSASDQVLTTYSANWTISAGDFQVKGATDDVTPYSTGAECGAYWNANSFNANQYAQTVTTSAGVSDRPGPAVRATGSGNYYGFYSSDVGNYLFKMVSGSWTQLGSSGGVGFAINDVVRLEVSGTSLTPKINGSTTNTPGSQTDDALSTGSAGICGYTLDRDRLDNWEGGNLAGASTNSSKSSYLKGSSSTTSNKSAYLTGNALTNSSKTAYAKGLASDQTNKSAYLIGNELASSNKPAYIKGQNSTTGTVGAYIKGSSESTSSKTAYLVGSINATSNKQAYIEGNQAGGTTSSSKNSYTKGIGGWLYPDGDISQSDSWKRNTGETNNLYTVIDEELPDHNDYVYYDSPTVGKYFEESISNPNGPPLTGEVSIFWAGCIRSGVQSVSVKIELREGATVKASQIQALSSPDTLYTLTLTQEEKDSITNWNDIRVRVTIEAVT